MFNKILRSYKFYNPNPFTKLIYFIIAMMIYGIIAVIFGRKLKTLISLVVSWTIIAPFLCGLKNNIYTKYDKGYSAFIRLIPGAYDKFKIYQIVSFFHCLTIYLIIYIYGTVVISKLVNIELFNKYALFYTLVITLLIHGLTTIMTYTESKIQFITFFIIYGAAKKLATNLSLGFFNENNWISFVPNGDLETIKPFVAFLKSPNSISITTVVIFLYLWLVYKIYFIGTRKRW